MHVREKFSDSSCNCDCSYSSFVMGLVQHAMSSSSKILKVTTIQEGWNMNEVLTPSCRYHLSSRTLHQQVAPNPLHLYPSKAQELRAGKPCRPLHLQQTLGTTPCSKMGSAPDPSIHTCSSQTGCNRTLQASSKGRDPSSNLLPYPSTAPPHSKPLVPHNKQGCSTLGCRACRRALLISKQVCRVWLGLPSWARLTLVHRLQMDQGEMHALPPTSR